MKFSTIYEEKGHRLDFVEGGPGLKTGEELINAWEKANPGRIIIARKGRPTKNNSILFTLVESITNQELSQT